MLTCSSPFFVFSFSLTIGEPLRWQSPCGGFAFSDIIPHKELVFLLAKEHVVHGFLLY